MLPTSHEREYVVYTMPTNFSIISYGWTTDYRETTEFSDCRSDMAWRRSANNRFEEASLKVLPVTHIPGIYEDFTPVLKVDTYEQNKDTVMGSDEDKVLGIYLVRQIEPRVNFVAFYRKIPR